ncbi:MAG: hypothetical protein WB661_12905 [Candidatus Bathyarchaeia archaeon]
MPNYIFRFHTLLYLVYATGKFALVTLVSDSTHDVFPPDKLVEQIRRTIESSPLSDNWVVDTVAILDENGSATKIFSTNKAKEIAIT